MKYQTNKNFYYENNRDNLLQKYINRYKNIKVLLRSYVELENRLKALEGIFSPNDSENKTKVYHIDDFKT